ncbi:MAG: ABC transporter permease [Cellulosilyticaceae bacterium]
MYIESSGDWHGAFAVDITPRQVAYVKENPHVERTYIKTDFYALRPQETQGRPYFSHIDLNYDYRNGMGWEEMATVGMLPEKSGEIAISEDFFKDNPNYTVGSQLVVAEGKRLLEGAEIDVRDPLKEGETFEPISGERVYEIVGILDASHEFSDRPSYISIGYSDEILENRTYIMNMKFKNPRKTYELMPQMAANIGLMSDRQGNYPVRYYTGLLETYGVFEHGVTDQFLSMMTIYVVAGIAIGCFFIFIIYHTFAVSAKSRIKYLGLLKSIGASPKQIRHSVLFEGVLLSAIGIPFGLVGGYGVIQIIFGYLNKTYETLEMEGRVGVYVSPLVVLGIVLATLAVVLVSAYFPARKVARLSPIVAIKQSDYKVERFKETLFGTWIARVLGYEGTLALKSHSAHRKGFRAAYISLTLSFVILMGGVLYFNIWNLSMNYGEDFANYEMKLYLNDVSQEEFERLDREVRAIEQVQKVQRQKGNLYGLVAVRPDELSEVLRIKGTQYLEEEVPLEEGKYDFALEILAIDDASFEAYCKRIGANPEVFKDTEGVKGILYNQVTYNDRALREELESVPLFDWQVGHRLTVREDLGRQEQEEGMSPYVFDAEIGYVTDQIIDHGRYYDYYRIILIIPESMSYKLISNFSEINQQRYNRDTSYLDMAEEDIPIVKEQIESIYQKHKNKANFRIWDKISSIEGQRKSYELVILMVGIGVGFMTLIGVVNIYSTLSNQMHMRRKEFAMLKSTGLSPKGLKKMLVLECLFYSLKPILYSVPLLVAFGVFMLSMARLSWVNIVKVFPYGVFIRGSIIMAGIIFSITYLLSRKIQKESIIDVIKDEIQ